MTDEEIFERLKQGDRPALIWLYQNKRDYFIGYFINNFHLPVAKAMDLAIDALLALEASAQRNKERPLTAQITTLWIKIGRNIYLSEQKKEEKRITPLVNWEDFMEHITNTEGGENPFDSDDFEEILPFVTPYLNDMKEPCRTILKESFWEDKTDKAISDFLTNSDTLKDMSEAAVKMKRTRCIDELRTLIFNHLK